MEFFQSKQSWLDMFRGIDQAPEPPPEPAAPEYSQFTPTYMAMTGLLGLLTAGVGYYLTGRWSQSDELKEPALRDKPASNSLEQLKANAMGRDESKQIQDDGTGLMDEVPTTPPSSAALPNTPDAPRKKRRMSRSRTPSPVPFFAESDDDAQHKQRLNGEDDGDGLPNPSLLKVVPAAPPTSPATSGDSSVALQSGLPAASAAASVAPPKKPVNSGFSITIENGGDDDDDHKGSLTAESENGDEQAPLLLLTYHAQDQQQQLSLSDDDGEGSEHDGLVASGLPRAASDSNLLKAKP